MNHSPLPWKWYWKQSSDGNETDCGIFQEVAKGQAYSICRAPRYQTQEQWKADAKFICLAVNHHEELVSVLGLLLGRGASAGEPGYVSFAEMVQTGEALLAKLEAEK